MPSPSSIPMSESEFRQLVAQLFPDADDDILAKLYPMVNDLRELAARISACVIDNLPLSETGTGE